jgi:phage/plasmid-like protein (TIGR03299 family)
MSHDLDESTGKPAMAYVGERPWHGLGEALPPEQDIETWVKAARLDWGIEMLPVNYQMGGRNHVMRDRFVLARSDTQAALSVVSGDYRVVQPKEVLEFYRDLVEERHYKLETAGALDSGRKVWALARTGLVAGVADNAADELGAYVLLATSCDKSLATTIAFTSVRVVCQNTLSFAVHEVKKESRRSIKVNHSRRFDADQIKKDLGLMDESWEKFKLQLTPMAGKAMSDSAAEEFFQSLFQSEKEMKEGTISDQKRKEVMQLMSFYRHAPGQDLPTAKNTLWGAVSAVTYYVDHIRTASGDRLDSAWFGAGATLKEKAWQQALEQTESK